MGPKTDRVVFLWVSFYYITAPPLHVLKYLKYNKKWIWFSNLHL